MPEYPPELGIYKVKTRGYGALIPVAQFQDMDPAAAWAKYELDRSALLTRLHDLTEEHAQLCADRITSQVFARVAAWLKDPDRKPAATAFTSGMESQIANLIEQHILPVIKRNEVRVRRSCAEVREAVAELSGRGIEPKVMRLLRGALQRLETVEDTPAWDTLPPAGTDKPASASLPIRAIMDAVASWESRWAVDPPEQTKEGLRGMWNDLRQRLENLQHKLIDQ